MKRGAFILLIGATIAFVSAGHAKSASEQHELRTVVQAYARCIVEKHSDVASHVIVANYPNQIIAKSYASLIDNSCMAAVNKLDGVVFSGDSLRYALADALVNAKFAVEGPVSFADRLPLAHLPFPDRAEYDAALAKAKYKWQRDKVVAAYENELGAKWLSRYGECVVRLQPEKVRLWLLTPPDGPEEMGRINAVASAFAPCSPASAGPLRFSRMTMRGTVAINYYRLAMAAPAPGKQQ